jgi:Protein of unknown function (DUF3108)
MLPSCRPRSDAPTVSVTADKTGANATADMPDLRLRPSRPGFLNPLSLGSLRPASPGRGARWGVLIGLLLYALSAGQAYGSFDEPVELRYRFTWAGLPFAELGLRHATNRTVYQTEIAIRTIGLADQVVGFRASSHATGLYEEPDGFSASRFRSASSSYRKSRRIMVRYDRATGDVVELELTRSGEPDRSKVPADLQKGVMDPLTAVLQLRHRLATAGDLDGYKAAVFDGRRRFDATAKVIGRHRAEIAGRTWPVIELEIDLTWLAGANSDDMDKAEAGDNLLRLKLLLSDDERLIPLRLSTMDSLLTATAEIVPECLAPAGCTLVSG